MIGRTWTEHAVYLVDFDTKQKRRRRKTLLCPREFARFFCRLKYGYEWATGRERDFTSFRLVCCRLFAKIPDTLEDCRPVRVAKNVFVRSHDDPLPGWLRLPLEMRQEVLLHCPPTDLISYSLVPELARDVRRVRRLIYRSIPIDLVLDLSTCELSWRLLPDRRDTNTDEVLYTWCDDGSETKHPRRGFCGRWPEMIGYGYPRFKHTETFAQDCCRSSAPPSLASALSHTRRYWTLMPCPAVATLVVVIPRDSSSRMSCLAASMRASLSPPLAARSLQFDLLPTTPKLTQIVDEDERHAAYRELCCHRRRQIKSMLEVIRECRPKVIDIAGTMGTLPHDTAAWGTGVDEAVECVAAFGMDMDGLPGFKNLQCLHLRTINISGREWNKILKDWQTGSGRLFTVYSSVRAYKKTRYSVLTAGWAVDETRQCAEAACTCTSLHLHNAHGDKAAVVLYRAAAGCPFVNVVEVHLLEGDGAYRHCYDFGCSKLRHTNSKAEESTTHYQCFNCHERDEVGLLDSEEESDGEEEEEE